MSYVAAAMRPSLAASGEPPMTEAQVKRLVLILA